MIVYNFTVKIDRVVVDEWVEWVQRVYIPRALDSNHFEYCRVYKLQGVEKGGKTYALHLYSKSLKDLEDFLDEDEVSLLEEQLEKFRGRVHVSKSFSNFLEEIATTK